MARRKFREQRSKFYGTKQVLTDINLPAHLAIHDLDAAVIQLPAGGLAGQFLVKNSDADYDVSWGFASAFPSVLDGGSATPVGVDTIIDGGTATPDQTSNVDGGSA